MIEVLEVSSHVACIGRRNGAVNEEFGGGEVGGFSADVIGIINAIAADGPTHAPWVCFFWAHGGDDAQICYFAPFGTVGHVHKKHSVGAFLIAVSLGKATDFIRVGALP